MSVDRGIGFHVSIAGGLPAAVDRAVARHCTALQMFCGNPRGWALGERSDKEVEAFRTRRREAGLCPVVVHASYLLNPCAPEPVLREKTAKRLADELRLARRIEADLYVLHPGSAKGGDMDAAVEQAARCIGRAVQQAEFDRPVLLEGMSGAYGPGGSWHHMHDVAEQIRHLAPAAQIGATIDTAHAWARGYDFRRTDEVGRLVEEVDDAMGLDALRLVHLNDSKDECGSGRDRHQHLGKGQIGRQGLRNVLSDARIAARPIIMETPWVDAETDRENLETALDMLGA